MALRIVRATVYQSGHVFVRAVDLEAGQTYYNLPLGIQDEVMDLLNRGMESFQNMSDAELKDAEWQNHEVQGYLREYIERDRS